MSPRSLLSLNQDVSREIIAHLLLVTPRELHRTSILRTCSSLHLLGLPLLYRVVDLTGYQNMATVDRHWRALFGERGVLTTEGRNIEVGTFVRELKLGGASSYGYYQASLCQHDQALSSIGQKLLTFYPSSLVNLNPGFNITKLNMHNCSSLLLDTSMLSPSSHPSLPVIPSNSNPSQLAISSNCPASDPSLTNTYGGPPMHELGDLEDRGGLWRRLDVLIFEGYLWYDEFIDLATFDNLGRMISFLDRSFKVLVLRFSNAGRDEELVVDLFLNVDPRDQPAFLIDTERIKFSGGAKGVEKEFRKAVEEKKKVGLSEFEKRIASMIVFVDEDGMERSLLHQ